MPGIIPEAKSLALTKDGTLYAVSRGKSSLFEIDAAALDIRREIKLGEDLGSWDVRLLNGEKFAVVSSSRAHALSFINLVTGAVQHLKVNGAPVRLATIPTENGRDFIFAPLHDGNKTGVYVFEPSKGTGYLGDEAITNTGGFQAVADGTRKRVYVTNRDGRNVSVINAETWAVLATWPLPNEGIPYSAGVHGDTGQVYVVFAAKPTAEKNQPDWVEHPNRLAVFSPEGQVVRDVPVCDTGPDGGEILVGEAGGFFLACTNEAKVRQYNAGGNEIRSWSVGHKPFGLAYNPTTGELIVGLLGEGRIAKIETW